MQSVLSAPQVAVQGLGGQLAIEQLTVAYGSRTALRDVSFAVRQGERVAIIGPNGAGKSTLLKALIGLIPIQSGRVLVDGAERIAYVQQREQVDWRFPVTVWDVVMMGRYGRIGWFRRPGAADVAAVQFGLEQVGITQLARRSIGDLSGGQQQRVFLARALAQEPTILLLDEPFNGVDVGTQDAIMDVLDRLRMRSVTVLITTHDLDLAARAFDRVALLHEELVAWGAAREVFTTEHLRAAFGGQVILLDGTTAATDQHCSHC